MVIPTESAKSTPPLPPMLGIASNNYCLLPPQAQFFPDSFRRGPGQAQAAGPTNPCCTLRILKGNAPASAVQTRLGLQTNIKTNQDFFARFFSTAGLVFFLRQVFKTGFRFFPTADSGRHRGRALGLRQDSLTNSKSQGPET